MAIGVYFKLLLNIKNRYIIYTWPWTELAIGYRQRSSVPGARTQPPESGIDGIYGDSDLGHTKEHSSLMQHPPTESSVFWLNILFPLGGVSDQLKPGSSVASTKTWSGRIIKKGGGTYELRRTQYTLGPGQGSAGVLLQPGDLWTSPEFFLCEIQLFYYIPSPLLISARCQLSGLVLGNYCFTNTLQKA